MLKVAIAPDGPICAASMGMAASRRDWKFEPKETTPRVDIDF